MTMEAHPAAKLFPMLPDARLKELAEDIRANGQREPIKVYQGTILDGRNRYAACALANVEPKIEEFDPGDPYAYVWSLNGQRRDLGADQRYLIWKAATEASAAWQAEQAERRDAANRARSEAQAGIPKAERPATHCGDTFRDYATEAERKTSTEKAVASKTNRGAVERMDRLARERPDLAESVMHGEVRPAEALRQMKKAQVAEKVRALPAGKYRVIYADPPWSYGDSRTNLGTATGAEHHYPTMPTQDICALDVVGLSADDAVLFCWATCPLLEDALKVIRAWGFTYKTHFVWDKVRHNLGHYLSVRHELLMIATRGSCLPDSSTLLDSVVELRKTDKHSEKPEEFRAFIDQMYSHGPRIELFRRGAAPAGWDVWGNETDAA